MAQVNAASGRTGFNPEITLDVLFRRNAATRGGEPALVDTGGRRYSYAEALAVSNHICAQIAALNLPPKSAIVLLFPNGAELVLTLLAVLRAGHVPVPVPVAWRKSDLVRACREAEAAALITTAHYSAENLPQLAADVAIEAFELSFPCAFGAPLPDGVTPLSLSAKSGCEEIRPAPSSGIGTLHTEVGGVSFVLHRDEEMIAGGLSAMLAADVQASDKIMSAISPASFAGIVTVLVPWLLSGGTLTLLADTEALIASPAARTHLIASAGAILPLYELLSAPLASVIAVHFSAAQYASDYSSIDAKRIVDAYPIGEFAVVTARRMALVTAAQSIPAGPMHSGLPNAAPVLETSFDDSGSLFVRGTMVPQERLGAGGWIETGYSVRRLGANAFLPLPPAGIGAIGALRISFPDLERRILAAALVSRVVMINDAILGQRLVIESDRPEITLRALTDAGLPRVIAGAVRKTNAHKALA